MRAIPRVSVGQTPVSRYASWDEHRRAIHRDAMSQLNGKLIECAAKVAV